MKKSIKIAIIIGFFLIIIIAISWSIWFSYQQSQTVFQRTLSSIGYKKPDSNVVNGIVFLGDSITKREDWNVLFNNSSIINAGIPGNTTDDVLNRLGVITKNKPYKIFLMIGINDLLNGQDVNHVIANYRAILNEIRESSPDTIIYVQSILPVNNNILKSETVENQEIMLVNNEIEKSADGNKIIFIDLYPSFCDSENSLYGKYSQDGLHPNSHGYSVWKELIEKYEII
ncbi:MAG: GDSL-type esterase/lipase family protein [Candidatus Moraniibacteriota bacterium]